MCHDPDGRGAGGREGRGAARAIVGPQVARGGAPQTRTRTVRDCLTPSFATRFEMSFALGELDLDAERPTKVVVYHDGRMDAASGKGGDKKKKLSTDADNPLGEALVASTPRELCTELPGRGVRVLPLFDEEADGPSRPSPPSHHP